MKPVLILYCSPADQDRLRIDREHKAVDEAIKENGLAGDLVTRKQAATIRDLVDVLNGDFYSIVQFSGHGSDQTLVFESEKTGGEELGLNDFVNLLKITQPDLRLVILLSCFSNAAAAALHGVSPYVITVQGEANDSAIIDFVAGFYLYYFQSRSVEKAFASASILMKKGATILLSRRIDTVDKSQTIFVRLSALPFENGLYIDLSEAEGNIQSLGIPRDDFVRILSRKMRIHRNIFETPRENAVISIGEYIGVFSWTSGDDIIKCHKILKIRDDVDPSFIEVWADFSVIYNDCTAEKYRSVAEPASPANRGLLRRSLEYYSDVYSNYFDGRSLEKCGLSLAPKMYPISKSLIKSNLELARTKLEVEEFQDVVYHLESALSAMHDIADGIANALTEKGDISLSERQEKSNY